MILCVVEFPNDIIDYGSQCNGGASEFSPPMSFNKKLPINPVLMVLKLWKIKYLVLIKEVVLTR